MNVLFESCCDSKQKDKLGKLPSREFLAEEIKMTKACIEWNTMAKIKIQIATKWRLTVEVKEHKKPRLTTWKYS